MDILYLLIPLSVIAMLGAMAVFAWALDRDQFEDLEREGQRILEADNDAPSVDPDQRGAPSGRAE
ncbi:MAG: cbb3-type cytochrome oxidase assembly protein CcoS [Burkholderiales bacterium]|nr:MAG: cbb3-type cytochrome oxidase assembly protein CcoS [Burkholderiales bacterium]